MECFAGVAAGGFAAKEAYQYNRENFLYDRALRRRKEFQVQKFRVDQAELWRRDVRDLISLTEYKMHVYLLVNVLLLGITVALWCQGKLPHTTPVWLMTGNALAMAGAFSFILLSIWMAMHAAVSAQSFEARLLTQMVRLPIPSWQEIEACRTYASEFERLEGKQMFRIPFVMGKQEDMIPPEDTGGDGDETPSARSRRFLAESHVDPWGLEGTGANVPELGSKMGHGMHKYRHVKLARQAMAFWQSYDAFARICMSIGVNQLLNAASYFILAYYMTEAKVPSSATYGVVVLTTMAETLNRLDMSLTWWQLRLMQLFLYLGPAIACMAGWAWVEDGWEITAEALVVCAFLAHALYLLTVNTLCHMHLEHNGAMLPVVFRSVLYLDVFGWSSQARHQGGSMSPRVSTPMTNASSPASCIATGPDAMTKPATAMVEHQNGRFVPRRPEAAAKDNDLQHAAGAPDVGGDGDHPITGFSEFYKAEGWLSTTNDIPDEDSVVTGCEHQGAIKLPRQTFSFAMNLLCFAWMVAAFYFAFVISKATLINRHAFFERVKPSLLDARIPRLFSFLEMGEEHLSSEDLVKVSWPHENVLPQAFACDADGKEFVVSDGLSLFSARLKTPLEPKAPLLAHFSEASVPCLPGESLLDATVRCSADASGSCEALVLHRSGRRLSSCRLGDISGNREGRDISDGWLEELRGGVMEGLRAPHARVEKAVTLTSKAHCTGDDCILLGTSRGRLVRLGGSSSSKLTPTHAVLDRDPHEAEYWEPGSVRSVGADHVGVLAQNGTRLHIHGNDGRLTGHLVLSEAAQSFCASGQHLYFLDMGPSPKIWRLPLPQMI